MSEVSSVSAAPGSTAVVNTMGRSRRHGDARRGAGGGDVAIFREIETWREALARGFAGSNPGLSVRNLNLAVRGTVDGILFLRMCEGRGIEPHGQLADLCNGGAVHARLRKLLRLADRIQDVSPSGCPIEPTAEQALCPTLDDEVIEQIFQRLYPPDCPVAFADLPPEILGRVYERGCGSEIRLTTGRRMVFINKPGAKKAGGVFYTPSGVVDEIVASTVGMLLEGRTPRDVGPDGETDRGRRRRRGTRAAVIRQPLRVLDPACGSGAFLLGAYRHLLDWHRDGYVANGPRKCPARVCEGPAGQWRLTIQEQKRILLNNVFGVDIDAEAVEITKHSLLLIALEGQASETTDRPRRPSRGHLMADLGDNIKCGDSLIGPATGDDEHRPCREPGDRDAAGGFDWRAEFPDVFTGSSPGFDVVIGNPPYRSFSGRQAAELSRRERSYFTSHYETGGWMTSHGMFIERAVRDLSKRLTAFIVPDQVGHLDGYRSVRRVVTRHAGLAEVRYWGEGTFKDVVTPALTFVADRTHRGETVIRQPGGGRTRRTLCEDGDAWTPQAMPDLLLKLRRNASSLGTLVADPGVHTGNCARKLVLPASEATPTCVPILEGRQVSRYGCLPPAKVLRLDYRAQGREYFTVRARHRYTDAAFVIRQTAAFPIVGPREHADYFRNSLLALYRPADSTDVHYLVGLLNSRLMRYVYGRTVQESQQKAFPQVKVRSLRGLPIRKIDHRNRRDKTRHDRIVQRVRQMLDLHRQRATAEKRADETAIKRQIDAKDQQIDRLVYALYDLTDDEIRTLDKTV